MPVVSLSAKITTVTVRAMTSVMLPPAGQAVPPRPTRRTRLRIAIGVALAVLLLGGVGFGIGYWRYAATYAPLQPGSFGGPYGAGSQYFRLATTDLGDEIYVAGPTGAESGYVLQLVNDGSHDVTVTGYERLPAVASVRWSPYVFHAGGNGFGVRLPLRGLPARIPAHESIKIVLTLQHPNCDVNGGYGSMTEIPLHWTALGVHHTFDMPFGPFSTTFVPCPQYLPVKRVGRARH